MFEGVVRHRCTVWKCTGVLGQVWVCSVGKLKVLVVYFGLKVYLVCKVDWCSGVYLYVGVSGVGEGGTSRQVCS